MSDAYIDEIEKRKNEIADRAFRIEMTGWLVTGALGALALGALFLLPAVAGPGVAGLARLAVPIALGLGSGIAGMVTLKERERLKIDREFLESRMQGGNWGRGNWENYRTHVAEHGFSAPGIVQYQGQPANPNKSNTRQS